MKYFLASMHMCVCSNFKYLCIAQSVLRNWYCSF